MKKLRIGDIFEITTPVGKAYLHYIYENPSIGSLIRILQGLHQNTPDDIHNLVCSQEQFMIFFPLAAAYKKNIVQNVGFFPAERYTKPQFMRTEHNLKGISLGWHIVNTDSWHRQLVENLTPELKKLSPWGIWNDTLLIENLNSSWSLEKWG